MESITFKEAVSKLVEGLEITIDDSIESIKHQLQKWQASNDHTNDMSYKILRISSLCGEYLRSVNYNNLESNIIDELWSVVDRYIADYEFHKIDGIYDGLPLILRLRKKKFYALQRKELIKNASA